MDKLFSAGVLSIRTVRRLSTAVGSSLFISMFLRHIFFLLLSFLLFSWCVEYVDGMLQVRVKRFRGQWLQFSSMCVCVCL